MRLDTVSHMRSKLYVETSVISYLTARPSRDVIALGHQQLTREWWEQACREFEMYASRLVVAEAQLGDAVAAAARLAILEPITLLAETAACCALAGKLLAAGALPSKAASDALHIGVAAVHGMDYLVTWNCKHIANARMLRFVTETCRAAGFDAPVICTPEELAEE
jgi:predicted nucleic acid-binding protein